MSKATEKTEAIHRLKDGYGVAPGGTIYTIVQHVSRSGMSRSIRALVVVDGAVHDVSHLVAKATGSRFDRERGGVVVTGAGMDMAFHLVYTLAWAMFPDSTDVPSSSRAGYALTQRAL